MSIALSENESMARRHKKKPIAREVAARDRIDLRADPMWVARVERQAERFGTNVSAYIREAVTRRLEADESSDPSFSNE